MYLSCVVHDSPKLWKQWLPLAELWYNSSFHTALGCSPFKALYAYDPNLSLAPLDPQEVQQLVQDMVQDREIHLQSLKQHLLNAQSRMKLQADKKRSDVQFQLGEKVLLKLQPYVQTSVASRPYPKLAFKYYGPYTVLERVGSVAYRLQLPEGSPIHPVFHISQLKPFHEDYTPVYTELLKVKDMSIVEIVLEATLGEEGLWGRSTGEGKVDTFAGRCCYVGRFLCVARAVSTFSCLRSSKFFGRGRCYDCVNMK